jgi:hypothetical protein
MSAVTFKRVTHVYAIALDDKEYKVTHESWRGTAWQQQGEQWEVLSYRGNHATAYCDPDKPTYKRVVAAVKDALANGNVIGRVA